MAMVRDPNNRPERAAAALQRDAALGRVSRTRRWLLAGAAALTAALAALASALLPGKSLGAKVHATHASSKPVVRRSSSSVPGLPPPAGAAALGLRTEGSNSEGSNSEGSSAGDGNSGAGNSGEGNSGSGNSGNTGSPAAQPAPQPAPAPAPAPAASGNSGNSGGGVTSGGS
jgi:hypothetical protein